MDCAAIEQALLAGEPLDGTAAREHLAGCESCRFLVGDGAPVAHALAETHSAAAAPPELAALEQAVVADLAGERGPTAWLRSRSRLVRTVLVAALVGVEALFMATYLRRADWDVFPAWRLGLTAGGFALVAVVFGWLALRPVYLRRLPLGVERGLLVLAIALPFIVALLPEEPTTVTIKWFTYQGFAFRCFAYGSTLALFVILAARALDRGGHLSRFSALAAAIAGGYAALLGLAVECPVNFPLHLCTGHATVPAGMALGYLLFRRT